MHEKRIRILDEALKLVPFDGWNAKTLADAAEHAGFDPKYAQIAFPEGTADAVDFFMRCLDKQMLDKLSEYDLNKMKIREKIKLAVKVRLEISEQYKYAIRKTAAFLANPLNSGLATISLWKTVDRIWYAVGDTSNDFNHYTKRITLAGVYSSTLLYWLGDKSENHFDTWNFLDRRIENVMQFNKLKSKATEKLEKIIKKAS